MGWMRVVTIAVAGPSLQVLGGSPFSSHLHPGVGEVDALSLSFVSSFYTPWIFNS